MTKMKNIIRTLMVAIAILSAIPVSAQMNDQFASIASYKKSKSIKSRIAQDTTGDTKDASTGYIGFRFMPTFTVLDLKAEGAVVETSTVLGYGFGGVLGFNFSDHFGIQVEVIYSSLAQKYKLRDRESTIKLSYINIPLLLVYNTDYSKPVNFNIVAGPQLGLNVGSTLDADANGAGTDTLQARLAVKKGDIGIAYGAGLDFGMGTSGSVRLSIGFRGVIGIVDISDRSNNLTTNEYYILDRSKVKTYAGYIGVTFAF
jgi:hypothetical protein